MTYDADVAKHTAHNNGNQGYLEDKATIEATIVDGSQANFHPDVQEHLDLPYKGLNPYTEADADIFFGRKNDVQSVINNLLAWHLTILYGKSGVGKSSLLRAGVAQRLNEEAQQNFEDYGTPKLAVVVFPSLDGQFSWKDDPLVGLIELIKKTIAESSWSIQPPEPGLSFVETLRAWVKALGRKEEDGQIYIILDQFEEYFLYHAQDNSEKSFATEFPHAVKCTDLRVNFLISMREDSFAYLDRFKNYIPGLFDHYLRLSHLDGRAARSAIKEPIEYYNHKHNENESITIAKRLVKSVLENVQVGKVVLGESGIGGSDVHAQTPEEDMQIEAPFLQLVMTRLWQEELNQGSPILRLKTFNKLGGAEQIVKDHLNSKMKLLTEEEKNIAAKVFQNLVTSSGIKYAYTILDLAENTGCDKTQLKPLLEKLASGKQWILRPVDPTKPDQPDTQRYEIFHDVLAGAILAWRRKYLETQTLEREKAKLEEKRRQETERLRVEAEKQRVETQMQRVKVEKRWGIALLATALVALVSVAGLWYWSVRTQEIGKLNLQGSQALVQWQTSDPLNTLQAAMEVGQRVKSQNLVKQVPTSVLALQQILGSIPEQNQWKFTQGMPGVVGSSFDGQWLAVGSLDGKIYLWSLQNQRWSEFKATNETINSIDVSAGGQRIATATAKGQILVWDANGKLLKEFKSQTKDGFLSISLSPDGRKLAVISLDSTRFWEVDSGQEISLPWKTDEEQVFNVRFSSDSQILAITGRRSTIGESFFALWNLQGKQLMRIAYQGMISDIRFSPDGQRLAIAFLDGTAGLWDLQGKLLTKFQVYGGNIRLLSFSPDGRKLAIVTADGFARVWDLEGNQKFLFKGHDSDVAAISFSQDGQQLTTLTRLGTVSLWSLNDKKPTALTLTIPSNPKSLIQGVAELIFSPDGQQIAATSLDGTAYLWSVGKDGQPPKKTFPGGGETTFRSKNQVLLSPNGQQLATIASDGTARLWSVEDKAHPIVLFPGKLEEGAVGIDLGSDNDKSRLVTASKDGMIRLWDFQGNLLKEFQGAKGRISNAVFSPNGQLIATVSWEDNIPRLWDLQGNPLAQLEGHDSRIIGIHFSLDGQHLVTASLDGTVRLWNMKGKEILDSPIQIGSSVISVRFSLDGQLLSTASFDGTARLWNLQGKKLAEYGSDSAVWDANFSPDGKQLATGGWGNTVQLWSVKNLDQLLQEGCTWMKDYLNTHPEVKKELQVCKTP